MSSDSIADTKFYKRAKRLTGMGIYIVPAYPGDNQSFFDNSTELATRSMSTVDEWINKGYPLRKGPHLLTGDYNWVCIAKSDGVGCLDVDDPEKCKALGMPALPEDVFIVDTAGGKGLHVPFVHTDETRALGSVRNVYEDPTVKKSPIFEFKGHNQPWCGPWQMRRDGGVYKPRNGAAPLMVGNPPVLIAWLIEHSKSPAPRQKAVPWKFYDDEALAHFLEHYNVVEAQSYEEEGSLWVVVEECPLCGRNSHKGTGKAARCKFIFGGSGYGFVAHCCGVEGDGATAEFEAAMEAKGIEPYPYYLYESDGPLPPDGLPGFEIGDVPDPPAPRVEQEPDLGITGIFPDAVEGILPEPESKLKYPELRFPREAIPPGRFKELVDNICAGGLDPGLAVPAIFALVSALPTHTEMDGDRIGMYFCLIGLVGSGKDLAMKLTQRALGLEDDPVIRYYTPSGERSVPLQMGDSPGTKDDPGRKPGPTRLCFVTPELEETLKKAKAETSGVLQSLQYFYDYNHKTVDGIRGERITINCRLSWLTALPCGTKEIDTTLFKEAFGASTAHGIGSRMLFGFAETRVDPRRYRKWKPTELTQPLIEVRETEGVGPVTCETHGSLKSELMKARVEGFESSELEKLYDNWAPGRDLSGRDFQHAHKLAILFALIQGHDLITREDWDFAVALMGWQTQIRLVFTAGRAKQVNAAQFNEIVFEEMMKRTKKRLAPDGKDSGMVKLVTQGERSFVYVRWRAMSNDKRWYKNGMDVERTVNTMVNGGTFAYLIEHEYDDQGKEKSEAENKNWIKVINAVALLKEEL